MMDVQSEAQGMNPLTDMVDWLNYWTYPVNWNYNFSMIL
jgi:hypothetical protein